MKIVLVAYRGIQPCGYVRSVSAYGKVSITQGKDKARKFNTEWEAQSAIDLGVVDALNKGIMLAMGN